MKRRAWLTALIAVVLLLQTGCWVFSVYPLAQPADETVFDKLLVGHWVQGKKGCSVDFTRFGDEKTYRVVYSASLEGKDCLIGEGQSASFQGTLIEIGGVRFLDLFPADREQPHHVLLLHSFYRVRVDATALWLTPLNFDWLQAQVNQNKQDLAGITRSDGMLVLTASTQQLRDFLQSNVNSSDAFPTAKRLDFDRKVEP